MKLTDSQYARAYTAWKECPGTTREAFEAFIEAVNKPEPILCKHCDKEIVLKSKTWTHLTPDNKKREESIYCNWTVAEPAE